MQIIVLNVTAKLIRAVVLSALLPAFLAPTFCYRTWHPTTHIPEPAAGRRQLLCYFSQYEVGIGYNIGIKLCWSRVIIGRKWL
jgi:hypothetical protein